MLSSQTLRVSKDFKVVPSKNDLIAIKKNKRILQVRDFRMFLDFQILKQNGRDETGELVFGKCFDSQIHDLVWMNLDYSREQQQELLVATSNSLHYISAQEEVVYPLPVFIHQSLIKSIQHYCKRNDATRKSKEDLRFEKAYNNNKTTFSQNREISTRIQQLQAIYPKWRIKLTKWSGLAILYNQLGQLLIYHKYAVNAFKKIELKDKGLFFKSQRKSRD